jgi:hypothetical protein
VTSQLAYFSDKDAGRQVAGAVAGNAQKHARGLMEHLDQGQWRPVWDEPLLNEVSPVKAIVSSSGQAVTFDNWHGMGYGKDVVTIYELPFDVATGQAVALDEKAWSDAALASETLLDRSHGDSHWQTVDVENRN